MEASKRLTCDDCGNTYKSKATLYIHRRQYCPMRNTKAAKRRQISVHSSPIESSTSPWSGSSPAIIVKTPYKQPAIERDPLALDTPEGKLKGEPGPEDDIDEKRVSAFSKVSGDEEFQFNEDDIAYWKEFVLGTQC